MMIHISSEHVFLSNRQQMIIQKSCFRDTKTISELRKHGEFCPKYSQLTCHSSPDNVRYRCFIMRPGCS